MLCFKGSLVLLQLQNKTVSLADKYIYREASRSSANRRESEQLTKTAVQATLNAKESIAWGTNVVGGVTPGKNGDHLGLPVLPTVRDVSMF